MKTQTKTPQIGWYRYCDDQTIVWFTGGRDHDGDLVFLTVKGEVWYLDEVDIERLPDCTGFDWTPETEALSRVKPPESPRG